MAIIQVNVLVSEHDIDRMSEIVKHAERAGLAVQQAFNELGVVTGEIDDAKLAELRAIKGVDNVEQQSNYQLPPSGDDVQ